MPDVPGMDLDQHFQDTYRRGNKRWIDFMLGTPKIRECVQRRGALEYNDSIVSDHRGMFIDLNAASLFGGATDDHVAASSRGFTSKNEKKVKKYLDDLDKNFVDHKICSRIDSLAEEAPTLTHRQLKQLYKGIDNDITRGMLAAERKVRPCHPFEIEWSPDLDREGYGLRYWRVRYSDLKNNSTSHKALARCFVRAEMKESNDDPLWDLDKIWEKLIVARSTLREAQKKHKENRDKCLREALEKIEREVKEAEDPAKAKKAAAAIKSVIRKHRTQESYNRIRQVT
jgi:hypothetical protein